MSAEVSRKSTPAHDLKPKVLSAKAQEAQNLKVLKQQYQQYLKAPKFGLDSEELYCTCRKPDEGSLMVCCDGCENWWHFKCMDVPEKYQHLTLEFYCKFCDVLLGKGKTKWKKKCRLSDCYMPIDGASKYCSREHGVQFLRGQLQPQMTECVQRSGSFGEFKELGSALPKLETYPDGLKSALGGVDEQIAGLRKTLAELSEQQMLLKQIKDRTRMISECIACLRAGEDIERFFDGEVASQKGKKKTGDICGYDKRLVDLAKMRGLIPEYFANLKELGFSKEKFQADFALLEEGEVTDDNDFASICIVDKRKCTVHHSWLNIISEGVDFKVADFEYRISTLEKKKELLVRDATIKHYELIT